MIQARKLVRVYHGEPSWQLAGEFADEHELMVKQGLGDYLIYEATKQTVEGIEETPDPPPTRWGFDRVIRIEAPEQKLKVITLA
jgi:hypothetical protein